MYKLTRICIELDENEHLQVKSKLQKQTRDTLEHKIEILEKQLGKDKNGEKKCGVRFGNFSFKIP